MPTLSDKNELKVNIQDEVILKYIRPAHDCLTSEFYDASLILSQVLLERVIRRVFRIHARKLRISARDIDSYLESIGQKFDSLVDKPFKLILNKKFHNLISEGLVTDKERSFFNTFWSNFINISKPIRNKLVHLGESESPSLTVNCTKNNFYLIELIVESCKHSSIPFNPVDDMRIIRFKAPDNIILRSHIKENRSSTIEINYQNLRLNNNRYEGGK